MPAEYPMRLICFLLFIGLASSCSLTPGSLRKLKRKHVPVVPATTTVHLSPDSMHRAAITYLGAGGLAINFRDEYILVDPFFSNQTAFRIGGSVLFDKRNLRTRARMLKAGLAAFQPNPGNGQEVVAILNTHGHYDHLMDIPAVYGQLPVKPAVLLSRSAYNIVHQTIDSSRAIILEEVSSTREKAGAPVIIPRRRGSVHVYPILSRHNPHFKNIKFFSGEQAAPQPHLVSSFGRTRANLWLEGNTFSFLVDFVDENNVIEFRMFIQSSSCSAPWGIPPSSLLNREVDLACIGVVSYAFSPGYPCDLLAALAPKEILWVHWEDFFRKYTRKPKTVRGTDVPAFFDLPCVAGYKTRGKILWPRAKMIVVY